MKNAEIRYTECFAVPGCDNSLDLIHPQTGRGAYFGSTLGEIRRQYPTAEITTLEKFCAEVIQRQKAPITLSEVSEKHYWEMLEVLPPAIMLAGNFCVGEPVDHCAETQQPRYDAFFSDGSKYFAALRPMTVKEFRGMVARKHGGACPP